MGAQGYEQIPHYLLWKRIGRWLQTKFGNIRNRGGDDTYRDYQDRDEDFRYSSPPLISTEPVDPPLVNPTTITNYHQQGHPTSKPPIRQTDDADERLLQV